MFIQKPIPPTVLVRIYWKFICDHDNAFTLKGDYILFNTFLPLLWLWGHIISLQSISITLWRCVHAMYMDAHVFRFTGRKGRGTYSYGASSVRRQLSLKSYLLSHSFHLNLLKFGIHVPWISPDICTSPLFAIFAHGPGNGQFKKNVILKFSLFNNFFLIFNFSFFKFFFFLVFV